MTLQTWLAAREDRCTHGYAREQHLAFCACSTGAASEWATFKAALRTAARADGTIHQTDVRPLIQSIAPKHRGQMYVKAKNAGLIVFVGKEPSTDAAGKNTDKDQKVWKLVAA